MFNQHDPKFIEKKRKAIAKVHADMINKGHSLTEDEISSKTQDLLDCIVCSPYLVEENNYPEEEKIKRTYYYVDLVETWFFPHPDYCSSAAHYVVRSLLFND